MQYIGAFILGVVATIIVEIALAATCACIAGGTAETEAGKESDQG